MSAARIVPQYLSYAHLLALLVPSLLLLGALAFQQFAGLFPCELCMQQRYALMVAVALSFSALSMTSLKLRFVMILAAATSIATSATIGIEHLGIERHWWTGHSSCSVATKATASTDQILQSIMNAPMIRCDQSQWDLAGLTLADFNAGLSTATAFLIAIFLIRALRPTRSQ